LPTHLLPTHAVYPLLGCTRFRLVTFTHTHLWFLVVTVGIAPLLQLEPLPTQLDSTHIHPVAHTVASLPLPHTRIWIAVWLLPFDLDCLCPGWTLRLVGWWFRYIRLRLRLSYGLHLLGSHTPHGSPFAGSRLFGFTHIHCPGLPHTHTHLPTPHIPWIAAVTLWIAPVAGYIYMVAGCTQDLVGLVEHGWLVTPTRLVTHSWIGLVALGWLHTQFGLHLQLPLWIT